MGAPELRNSDRIFSEIARADEGFEHAFTSERFETEQSRRLPERKGQPRHFAKFLPNTRVHSAFVLRNRNRTVLAYAASRK